MEQKPTLTPKQQLCVGQFREWEFEQAELTRKSLFSQRFATVG
jgi:hypothetical protein